MIDQVIPILPPAPNRFQDTEVQFISKADTFVAAFAPLVTSLNTFGVQLNATQTEFNEGMVITTTKAAEALASQEAALASEQSAADSEGVALTQAEVATTKAAEALASQGAALVSEQNALASENVTNTKANEASASATSASASEQDAAISATIASEKADIATTKASEAFASAQDAQDSATIATNIVHNTGAWNSATAYVVGECAIYNGHIYMALEANTNVIPTTEVTWAEIDNLGEVLQATTLYTNVRAHEGIAKGQAVKFHSYNGTTHVALASQQTDVAIGIALENIAANTFGNIAQSGTIEGVNLSAFTAGEILYVGSNGNLTNVLPTTGYVQPIALVLKNHINNGAMEVQASAPQVDVDISALII